jgi:3,4-dihydroxyphenylacetate 2,3-dioxygenase
MNDLEECFQWGRYIVQTLRESERRGAFVASGALSHRLVRGPEKWPLPEHRELDERFAAMLAEGDYEAAWKWLPEFAGAVDAEMGGRHLAMMSVLSRGGRLHATVHAAYGPSSEAETTRSLSPLRIP